MSFDTVFLHLYRHRSLMALYYYYNVYTTKDTPHLYLLSVDLAKTSLYHKIREHHNLKVYLKSEHYPDKESVRISANSNSVGFK